ncbi:MAG TPA: hypothetical protein PK926_12590 [Spirochaetota bacterium]|nr:hypothetical protein [Spirochaetota bacterium]HPI89206.1 hypothetical protein [Spirochaetota bacterium]HPR48977.1 hypothetical protein [Spirochaetota bacterium]
MEKRKNNRFNVNEVVPPGSEPDIYVELDLNGMIRGRAIDISLFGLGLIIDEINEKQIEAFRTMEEVFMKLYYGGEIILLGVKNVWNRLLSESGKMVFKSGVKINIISPEDKLKLSSLIEKMRNARV